MIPISGEPGADLLLTRRDGRAAEIAHRQEVADEQRITQLRRRLVDGLPLMLAGERE
ncbi:hypothetical protein [Defluviicoccus vanus]|uniref:Uncharacterized protein n=1 Tax=Defluviicoccus vanus TaxID=111831 RepID=A0A7H1MYA8_9PROT|nr:hypothetical protein [Defluviicoccus vanus]QNT68444.1 hypothetical protein HQ394_02530 [Defluviicoccus vanus]